MTSLQELQRNWEKLAQSDPLWSICTDPKKSGRRWDPREFFETGKREIDTVLEYVRLLRLTLDKAAPALDFGCGVGRLTRALSNHFSECWGVDISPTMIRMAQDFHRDRERCVFRLNQTNSLPMFQNGYFGFIYASIVFQHIERKYVENYLLEMVRILKPGGIFVFQMPEFRAGAMEGLRHKVRLRSRLDRWFKKRQDAHLMDMHYISEDAVRKFLSNQNVHIADVQRTNSIDPAFNGILHYLDDDPECRYISKQYCLIKSL